MNKHFQERTTDNLLVVSSKPAAAILATHYDIIPVGFTKDIDNKPQILFEDIEDTRLVLEELGTAHDMLYTPDHEPSDAELAYAVMQGRANDVYENCNLPRIFDEY